ncbi:serine/threonine-protein kinase [Nannocystis sp. ILAH1]|uniref:serine/threonine-protein kinase n=1 Tax=unclassified Nannocystis TaxID=2627009 RepID=UPI00226EB82B|nr:MULTISPECIES: serine/threonine-protein kinase [unclassified Nannocystis]MCY0986496.1 serine/threonine-protein kinase [Nannocystis sp. ILAH1]MCY1071371.1 serine/threonine-protein kinase [Nannocystis sp. RBIL2]
MLSTPDDATFATQATCLLEQEAIFRRISARLFGEENEPIYIGRFRVLDILGRGGMGVVYAAEDDKLGRRVALKVIREPGRRASERARLLAEARAQARLSHPNVVQVYEVGEVDDSVFVVMELVDGVTLDAWLKAQARPLTGILAVFVAAGRGLEAAHAAGLVHRDIKPSNILVGQDGRVRLADFGLARGADEAGPSAPTLPDVHADSTAPGHAPAGSSFGAGTPAYMSPEHRGNRPDARSDQFSFCITLFEAVYGVLPFDPVTFAPRAPPDSSARRVPRRLRRLLDRGLAHDPRRRFPSMSDLVVALEAGARRRWLGIGVSIAGVVALCGSLAWMTVDPPPSCLRDPTVFDGIWDAERRQELARKMQAGGFSYEDVAGRRVSEGFDAYVAQWHATALSACEATHARRERSAESLQRSYQCLQRGRQALAERVRLLREGDGSHIAAVDTWLATLPDPAACERLGFEQLQTPAPQPQVGAELERAQLLLQIRHGRAARPVVASALAASVALGDRIGQAEALLLRARIEAEDLGDSRTAIGTLDQAYALAVAASHDAIVWQLWNELARIHARDRGNAEDARTWLNRARSALDALPGRSPLGAASLLDTAAAIAILEQRHDAIEALRREALALREEQLPSHHPEVVEARQQLANALAESGRLREALASQQELLDEQLERWGPQHPATAAVAFNTGLTHLELGEFAAARRLLLQAREIFSRIDGPGSPRVGSADLYLARGAAESGDSGAAEALARAALAVFDAHFPPDHPERVVALGILAEVYRARGDHSAALPIVEALLTVHDRHGFPLDLAEVLTSLGDHLCELNRCGEALPAYARLADHLSRHPPASPSALAFPLQGMGRANLALGHPALALPLFERAMQLLRASPDASLPVLAETATNLAQSLEQLGIDRRRARELRRISASLQGEITRMAP